MQHFFIVTLELISQFTGGQGGIKHGIVVFGLAGMFWGVLLSLAWARQRHSQLPHEKLLLWGFSFWLGLYLFMMAMVSLQAYGFVHADSLHIIFPPIEHTIFGIAIVIVAAGYIQYLLENSLLSRRYLQIGIAAVLLCYIVTFFWWGQYIAVHPESKFGRTWSDWLFHVNTSILLVIAIVLLAKNTSGWVRNAVCTALFFFFLHEFLKLPDMALGEVYEYIFAPVRHGLYLLAIPIFGYVYIRELYEEHKLAVDELRKAHHTLDQKVKKRTAELEKKAEEVKILSGLLPICAQCKKIRDDKGYWNNLEAYIEKHSDVLFSHSICSECSDALYGSEDWYIKMKKEKNK